MIGVIGCGNMAGAIVRGMHRVYPEEAFMTYTPSYTRAKELAQDVGGKAVEELEAFKEADSIIIGCKPQQFADLAEKLKGKFDLSQKHFISIMAALPMDTIQNKLGAKRVSRVMPNTPSLFNQGVSLVLHSSDVKSMERELTLKMFSSVGKTHVLKSEEEFDKVTTVSGSGPAYVFQFAKAMSDRLQGWGIEAQEARKIVNQLFIGSSELMERNSNITLDELISQVTSKGGVTIEAVKVFREMELGSITEKALDAAYKRSIEMTKEFGEK